MKKFDEAKSDCEALGSYLADVSNGLELTINDAVTD